MYWYFPGQYLDEYGVNSLVHKPNGGGQRESAIAFSRCPPSPQKIEPCIYRVLVAVN